MSQLGVNTAEGRSGRFWHLIPNTLADFERTETLKLVEQHRSQLPKRQLGERV